MTRPIKLFWWKDKPNFGDGISRHVVAFVSGRDVVWAEPEDCDLFAVGSLMKWVRRSAGPARKAEGKPWLWGTGCIGPIRGDFLHHVRVASVRGPLTAEMLRLGPVPEGDAAILLPKIVEPVPAAQRAGIGIVAHHSKLDAYRGADRLSGRDVQLIDVTQDDPLEVVRQIARCRTIYSSSLHGLIVADAFHIENHWLDPHDNHAFSRFKFYDYAASVGRGLSQPLAPAGIDPHRDPGGRFDHWPAVDRLAAAAEAAFPAELRA